MSGRARIDPSYVAHVVAVLEEQRLSDGSRPASSRSGLGGPADAGTLSIGGFASRLPPASGNDSF